MKDNYDRMKAWADETERRQFEEKARELGWLPPTDAGNLLEALKAACERGVPHNSDTAALISSLVDTTAIVWSDQTPEMRAAFAEVAKAVDEHWDEIVERSDKEALLDWQSRAASLIHWVTLHMRPQAAGWQEASRLLAEAGIHS